MIPDDRKYSQEHEWVQVEGDIGTVGVTDHAASELGDIVYVDLPDVGSEFSAGDSVGSIESVKAVAEVYTPVTGEIVVGDLDDLVTGRGLRCRLTQLAIAVRPEAQHRRDAGRIRHRRMGEQHVLDLSRRQVHPVHGLRDAGLGDPIDVVFVR